MPVPNDVPTGVNLTAKKEETTLEYEFDSYRFIAQNDLLPAGRLYRSNGTEVTSIARSHHLCRLLSYLLEHHGADVKNPDVIKYVWNETRGAGEPHLAELVARLRRILDKADPYRYIERIGRGIRFKYPLSEAHRPDGPAAGAYSITPASEDDIRWAAGLAKGIYKGVDVISEEKMVEWYTANPNGFSIITSVKQNKRIGNIDILPLKPGTLRSFKEGGFHEPFITDDSIYHPHETERITNLYVESFVCVVDPDAKDYRTNHFAAALILSKFRMMAQRLCNPKQLDRVFALAASGGGKNLVDGLEFEPVPSIRPHQEGHTLYSCTFAKMVATLEEWYR
jgi:DNA-binding winged helix-turn-helix (wHTH) protein